MGLLQKKRTQQILRVTKGKDHKLYGLSIKRGNIIYIKGYKKGEGITKLYGLFKWGKYFFHSSQYNQHDKIQEKLEDSKLRTNIIKLIGIGTKRGKHHFHN